jgi:hypothetical protein
VPVIRNTGLRAGHPQLRLPCRSLNSHILEQEPIMFLLAHHMAVEIFGREFSPRTPLEHVCAFGVLGLVLALATYGAWALGMKAASGLRARRRV